MTSTDLYIAKFRQKIARCRQIYTLSISDKNSQMSTDLFFANFTQKIARHPQTYTLPNSGKK